MGPDYLAETGALMAAGAVDLILCNSRTVDERADGTTEIRVADRFHDRAPPGYWAAMGIADPGRFSVLDRYDLAAYLAYHPAVPTVTTLRRAFYQELGGFNPVLRGSSAENFEFGLRALCRARIGLVWQPLASVVRYGGNASADGAKMAMDLVAFLDFALSRHDLPPAEAGAVDAELQRRLPDAIDGAFRHADFLALRRPGLQVPPEMRHRLPSASLPPPLARFAAATLTRRGEAREGHAGR